MAEKMCGGDNDEMTVRYGHNTLEHDSSEGEGAELGGV